MVVGPAKLARIRSLVTRRSYTEALEACSSLLQEGESIEVLRIRASINSRLGDFDKAVEDYQLVLVSGSAELRDWYLAADNALEARRFLEAADLFGEVLRRGELEGEDWFRSASLFYRAYCYLMMGDASEAFTLLASAESADSQIELHLPGLGMCDVKRLRFQIARRLSNS